MDVATDDGGHGGGYAAADIIVYTNQIAPDQDAANGVVAIQIVAGAILGVFGARIVVWTQRDDVVVVQQRVERIHIDRFRITLLKIDDIRIAHFIDAIYRDTFDDALGIVSVRSILAGIVISWDLGIADDLMSLNVLADPNHVSAIAGVQLARNRDFRTGRYGMQLHGHVFLVASNGLLVGRGIIGLVPIGDFTN